MPLSFNSLVLIPSDHCNISCRHCAPECGPTAKQPWDVPLFAQCIRDAARIPQLARSVHFAGGEPFLYYPQMVELMGCARDAGFASSIVTNGFWGVKPARALEMVRRLVDLGLRRVELSTDVFHQEFIGPERIAQTIRVLKAAGVRVVLRVVTTRKHTLDETMRLFSVDDLDQLEIVGSPVVAVGRAAYQVPAEERYLSDQGLVGACASLLNLTVRGDGNVSPCCAGAEQTPCLSLGNIREAPLDEIVRHAEWKVLVQKLVHQGPASFLPILEAAGLSHKVKPQYTNICHACCELFNDPEVVEAVQRALVDTQVRQLTALLAQVPEIDFTAGPVPSYVPARNLVRVRVNRA